MNTIITAKKLHDRIATGAQEGTLRIAGLGDSITWGWEVDIGFFDRFIHRFRSVLPTCEVLSINAGVSGDTAIDGLARLRSVLSESPDILTVAFGINDMYCGVSVEEYTGALTEMVKRAAAAGTLPVLLTVNPLAWDDDDRRLDQYYDLVRALAQNMGLPLVDLARFWKTAGPAGTTLFLSDGVHPNSAGHALMAEGLLRGFSGQP